MKNKIFLSALMLTTALVKAYVPVLPLEFEFTLKEYTWFDLDP